MLEDCSKNFVFVFQGAFVFCFFYVLKGETKGKLTGVHLKQFLVREEEEEDMEGEDKAEGVSSSPSFVSV